MTAPVPPPMGQPASNTWKTLGIVGIVFAFCCPIVGIVLGLLSMNKAKEQGQPTTLGMAAMIIGAVMIVLGLVYRFALNS